MTVKKLPDSNNSITLIFMQNMKKYDCPAKIICGHKIIKLLLIMKLAIFIILFTSFQAVAFSGSAQKRIDLDLKDISITSVIQKIEAKYDYRFVYSNALGLDKEKVTVFAKGATIDYVMEQLLQKTSYSYNKINKGLVVIIGKGNINAVLPVTGKITDAKGQPVQGVSVVEKGTTSGAVTNAEGVFTLNVKDSNSVLTISAVGYETKEITVGNETNFDIVLNVAENKLEEVVVVGYGTQRQRDITTAISTLKTDKITALPFPNMTDALAGRLPGVILQASGGEPGSVAKITIRGGSGPDMGEPIFVIDGILSTKNDYSNLLPQDIEDISVLKDGASTAVYGAKGANGVILVTTKRGKTGKPRVSFSIYQDYSTPTVTPKLRNSYEYALAQNQAAILDGKTQNQLPYRQSQLDTIQNHLDLAKYPDNDWWNLTMRKYAPQTRYSLDMQGGTEGTRYFLSFAALDQASIYRANTTKFDRYNFRANITQKFAPLGLTIDANLYGIFSANNWPSSSPYDIFSNITFFSTPLKPAYNPDGTYAAGVFNPLVNTDARSGYSRRKDRNINGSLNFTWEVPWVEGLKAGLMGFGKTGDVFSKNWKTYAPQYNPDGTLQVAPAPTLYQSAERYWDYNIQARVEYNRTFGQHKINVLGIYEQAEGTSDNFNARRINYLSGAVDQLFAGSATDLQNSGSGAEYGRLGYIGRLGYSYASKYLLEGSFRYNGSDNFIQGKKWGFFPGVSIGWIVSQEGFWKDNISPSIMNFLKLRASKATVGNDAVSRFPYLSNYSLVNNSYVVGGTLINGFNDGGLINPYAVTWYTTKDLDLGADFAFLNNKITGSVDYFYKRTIGFITSPAGRYTTPLGTSLPVITSDGAYRSAGWDMSLTYQDRKNDWTYGLGGTLSLFNQLWEVKADEDSVTLKNPLTRQTHQTNYWGSAYISNGYYQTVSDIINNPRRNAANSLTPGDLSYEDVNGDGKIDASDFVRTGKSAFPHLSYSFTANAGYKAFSIDMLWQGTGQRNVLLGQSFQAANSARIVYDYQLDFWRADNTNALYPRQSLSEGRNSSNNYATSSFWLKNAKYLRLKSLRLSWDVKKQLGDKFRVFQSCIVTLSGTNLITFSPVQRFMDPESAGTDNYGYPVNKTYSVGLTVGF